MPQPHHKYGGGKFDDYKQKESDKEEEGDEEDKEDDKKVRVLLSVATQFPPRLAPPPSVIMRHSRRTAGKERCTEPSFVHKQTTKMGLG